MALKMETGLRAEERGGGKEEGGLGRCGGRGGGLVGQDLISRHIQGPSTRLGK